MGCSRGAILAGGRALAHDRRRPRAGGVPLVGAADRGISFRSRGTQPRSKPCDRLDRTCREDRKSPEAVCAWYPIEASEARRRRPSHGPGRHSPRSDIAKLGAGPVSAGLRSEPLDGALGAGSWLRSIWLAGVLVLTARLIVGSLGLARLVRRSSEVPDGSSTNAGRSPGDWAVVGGPGPPDDGGRDPLPGRTLAPRAAAAGRECDDGAARRPAGDPRPRAGARAESRPRLEPRGHLASIVLWFHPLAWRIRAAHAAACDAVCDAVAADLLGDVASYGRTLARLAVRAAWPSPAHGLAMARTSDVRRRLDALNRKVFRTPLSWRRVMPALFVGERAPGAHRRLRLHARRAGRARQPKAERSAKPADQKMHGKLTLRAVSAETNQPIEGVSIEYRRSRSDGKNEKGTVTTGKDGTATIDYPPSFKTGYFEITARKPKLVPIYMLWDDKRHPLELPVEKELRFEPGTTIGGIVQDEAGHPIEGATVDVHGPPTEYEGIEH